MRALWWLPLVLVAQAAEARPLKGMCEMMEPVSKLTGLKYVRASVQVKPKDAAVKPESVAFTIAAKAGTIKVPVAADGTVVIPVSKALCEENPDVQTNQPPGTLDLAIVVGVNAPPLQQFDYRVIMDMKADWDEGLSRQNFLYRAMAPSAKAGLILFAPGRAAWAEVRLPQGPRRFTADDKGTIRIPFDEAWKSSNPPVVLSEAPRAVSLTFQ